MKAFRTVCCDLLATHHDQTTHRGLGHTVTLDASPWWCRFVVVVAATLCKGVEKYTHQHVTRRSDLHVGATQDSVGGLQVETSDGEWVDAASDPGSIVVNFGDMLQVLTSKTSR